ncbi:MAG TPA: YceK/YidQ family lipoprotein [Candidatus Binatia bacterium]|jgi:uncharacterized protein YceK
MAILALMASGCAAGLSRVILPKGSEGVDVVGSERVPIPAAPYPYYFGTLFDVVCPSVPFVADSAGHRAPETSLLVPACVVDLPASLVLDTLLLPVDYWAHRRYADARAAHEARIMELQTRARTPPAE